MTDRPKDFIATGSQTVGPFFHIGLTDGHSLTKLAGVNARGRKIRLSLRVLDSDGSGIPDAMVEIWQADADGKYNHPDDLQQKTPDPAFTGFGRAAANEKGEIVFDTVEPGRVPGIDGALQAPHINVHVFARGILRHISTRIYFSGEHANAKDAILRLVPPTRKETLLAKPDSNEPGTWRLDLRLCGDNETVFFDA